MVDAELIRQIVCEVLNERSGLRAESDDSGGGYVAVQDNKRSDGNGREIVTAETIVNLADVGGIVTLPRTAILTPLARDYIADRKVSVQWTDELVERKQTPKRSAVQAYQTVCQPPAGPIAVTYDSRTLAVQQVLDGLGRQSLPLTLTEDTREDVSLAERIGQLAEQIGAGGVSAAIVFVAEPQFAVAYANRFAGVRAAQAGDWKSAEQAVRLIAANFMVIEYAERTFYQLLQSARSFVRAFAAAGKKGQWQDVLDGTAEK